MNKQVQHLCTILNAARLAKKSCAKRIQKLKSEMAYCANRIEDYEMTIRVIETMISLQYENVVSLLETTVTTGLQDVFNEAYEFKLDVKQTGKRMSANCLIKTDECEDFVSINYTQGTSIRELVACLLRITVCYLLDLKFKVVILDEPFSAFRSERQEIIHELIMDVAEKFQIQLLIITQNPAVLAHRVINVSKRKRKLNVRT